MSDPLTLSPTQRRDLLRRAANRADARYSGLRSNLRDVMEDALDDLEAGVDVPAATLRMAAEVGGDR